MRRAQFRPSVSHGAILIHDLQFGDRALRIVCDVLHLEINPWGDLPFPRLLVLGNFALVKSHPNEWGRVKLSPDSDIYAGALECVRCLALLPLGVALRTVDEVGYRRG